MVEVKGNHGKSNTTHKSRHRQPYFVFSVHSRPFLYSMLPDCVQVSKNRDIALAKSTCLALFAILTVQKASNRQSPKALDKFGSAKIVSTAWCNSSCETGIENFLTALVGGDCRICLVLLMVPRWPRRGNYLVESSACLITSAIESKALISSKNLSRISPSSRDFINSRRSAMVSSKLWSCPLRASNAAMQVAFLGGFLKISSAMRPPCEWDAWLGPVDWSRTLGGPAPFGLSFPR
jgi:hypothetical protein